jgi:hypothetical protein
MDDSATRVMLTPKRPVAPPPPARPTPAAAVVQEEAAPSGSRMNVVVIVGGVAALLLLMVVLWFLRPTPRETQEQPKPRPQGSQSGSSSSPPSNSSGSTTPSTGASTTGTQGSESTQAGGTPQPNPQQPPAVNPPVHQPETPDTGANTAIAQEVARRVQEARRFRAEGRSDRALGAAEAGLRADPNNRDLSELVNGILNDAQRAADSRRNDAVAANATAVAQFQEADDLSRRALSSRRSMRFGDAFTSWQAAAERYVQAISTAANARRQTPPSNSPTVKEEAQRPPILPSTGGPVTNAGQNAPVEPQRPPIQLEPPAKPPARPEPGTELQAIGRGVLERYAQAFRGLNLDALETLYPDLPEFRRKGLQDNKKNCQSMEVRYGGVEWVRLEAGTIEVRTNTSYDCRTRSGQRLQNDVKEGFVLKPTNGQWLITSMALYER